MSQFESGQRTQSPDGPHSQLYCSYSGWSCLRTSKFDAFQMSLDGLMLPQCPTSAYEPSMSTQSPGNGQMNPRITKSQNHRIPESSRLAETFKIIQSHHQPNTTIVTPKPHPQVPHADASWSQYPALKCVQGVQHNLSRLSEQTACATCLVHGSTASAPQSCSQAFQTLSESVAWGYRSTLKPPLLCADFSALLEQCFV